MQIIGLSGPPKGFSINTWLKNHPFNEKIVKSGERKILNHIKKVYPRGKEPNYIDWYAGCTNKNSLRYKVHKKNKSLNKLPHYKKIYMYSVSNARELEQRLYKKYNIGNSNTMGGIYINSRYVYVFHRAEAVSLGLL